MKKHLLKSLLVGLMTLAATSAWAADKTVVKYSFDDAMSPSLTAGSRVSFDYDKTSVITSTKFLNAYNNTNGDPGPSTVSLGSTDLSAETWTLSFEWAACGGCNSKADHTILKAGDTNLFDLTGNSNWNTTVTITYAGSDGTKTLPVPGCDKSKRFTAATGDQLNTTAYWHHIVVTGSSDGVKMTITNSSSGTAVVEDVVLSETNVNPTSLIIEPCCGGAIGIDELSLTYYVEGEVVQTPVANYSAVDGISRTITATCDTEGATLYYSTDGESWTEGASVTVSESGKVYFKAVKGTTESDVLEFDAEAGEAIVLNAPVIDRTSNTSVTISCDQAGLLLSPTATVYYTYGEESGSFTGSITLTVAADATITAYAEAEGYTTSETSERAVALFPTFVETLESIDAKTSGWSENAFSAETITASERTYAALMLDGNQWGQNVYLQTSGAWGLRASGNWYINSATDESWLLMQNMKKGDIVVVEVTYPASSMVNATFSKYTYGTRQAYEVTEDGDVELAFKKPNASEMDYLYGVYAYREIAKKTIALVPGEWEKDGATFAAYAWVGEENDWFPFVNLSGVYATEIPDNYTGIILTRINPEGTDENPWNNVWNQTEDIDFTTIANQTVFTITGWGEGEGAKSTYTAAPAVEIAKGMLQKVVDVAKTLGLDTTDAETLLANEEATVEQVNAALTALFTNLQQKAGDVVAMIKDFFNQFDANAAAALAPYFTAAETALAGNDYNAMREATTALAAQCLVEGKSAMEKVDGYLRKMGDDTLNADLDAVKTAIAGITDPNQILTLLPVIMKLKDDMTPAVTTYLGAVGTLISEGSAAGKDVSAMSTAYANVVALAVKYQAGTATLVEMGVALYQLIKAVEEYKAIVEKPFKVTFKTDRKWAKVYAYAWSGEGENVVKFLGDWPGTELTATEGVYEVTIDANAVPEYIIFSDGGTDQTPDLAFEVGKEYQYNLTIAEGSYYVMNMAKVNEMLGSPDLEELMNSGELYNQLFMAAGHNWGTKGIVNDKGLDFTLTYNPSNKTYDFDSRVSNGGSNHFLNNSLYMDGPSYGWTIEGDVPDCTISGMFDGVKKYIAVDANQELVLTENADEPTAKWTFIHKSNYEDMVNNYGLEAMKAATVDAPADATFLIKTPDFNRNDLRNAENWTIEAGNKNLAGGGDNGYGCAESYHSTFTLSQQLADAPAGVYALTAQGFYRQDDNKTEDAPVFYANEETATFPVKTGNENDMNAAGASFAAGTYAIDPIIVQVTEAGQLTVGAKGTATSQWVIWDNFQLKYYGAEATIDQVKAAALLVKVDELLAQLDKLLKSEEIEVESVVSKLTNAYEHYNENRPTDVTTAQVAIAFLTAAVDIGEGYIKAKNVLPQMKALTESTNFYTQEAYDNYYGQWYQKYEAGELAPDEANALEDPFVVTGWHASNAADDLLMSTWDAAPENWASYYINTWSVEGATDGTDFAVPFFEYWTGDDNSLGEKVLTGTMTGLEPGTYGVSAWVRVRGKNGFTAPAYGITMQAANGEAVNAVAATAVPNSNFYVGQITAIGEVAEDGVLTLKFNVAADNNISWLSFKNVKFNKMQTFTAKFENEDTWEKVYAYTWTGGEYDKVEQLGAWPGTEITATVDENGIYTATIAAQEAPANIIFSNGLEGEGHIQTEDFVFEDGKTYKYLIPATDIVVTPETGADIYAAVEAEKATVKKVGSISIVLAQDGSYTVSAPLVAYKNFEIQANGATIDANELNGNLIEMAATDNSAVTVPVEFVSIHNATVKGLKKPLFYSTQKGYLIDWLTIDNSIVEVAADVSSIDFTKGSAARNVNIENSTVYAPVATTKSFFSSQAGQKLTELDEEGIQSFIIKNATMYNLATGKNFFTHRQNSQKWLTFVAENNIFVNCGKNGQAIKGMNGGGSSTNPTWTISGNVFNFEVDGVMTDTSAAEVTGDAEEPIQNSYALVMTFVDPAGGDFNADFTAAEDATIPTEKIGDPRWTLNYKAPEVETTYYLVGSFNDWTASDTYKLTLNSEAGEGVVEYMLTLDIPANSSMKVQDNLGNWYPGDGRPNFEVNDEGNFTVYFRPNADGDEFWFEGYIYCNYNGKPTGINSIFAEAVENGKVYNLQGQKVQKTQKGLYIVNGKKMVVK